MLINKKVHLDILFLPDFVLIEDDDDLLPDLFFNYFSDYLLDSFDLDIDSSCLHVLEGISNVLIEFLPLVIRQVVICVGLVD